MNTISRRVLERAIHGPFDFPNDAAICALQLRANSHGSLRSRGHLFAIAGQMTLDGGRVPPRRERTAHREATPAGWHACAARPRAPGSSRTLDHAPGHTPGPARAPRPTAHRTRSRPAGLLVIS